VVRRVEDEKLNGGGREKSKGTVFSAACI
jgi:hypothetical protein